MFPDNILKDHIEKAIQEIDATGIEKGAHSSTYDVVYNNKRYPPKLVVSLANKYANGAILPRDSFQGGEGTPAFQLLESLGFEIEKKLKMDNQQLYDLKNAFLKEWPIDRLKKMTLEEYTNLDKTSFCYWVEAVTTDIGSIWGGSAYKFGIFKRKDLESENYNKRRKSDGEYSWYGKYGDTKEEVFENIRKSIINIATYSQQNKLKEIDEIDLGDAYKWKIAFLYGDFNIMNMFNRDGLKRVVLGLGLELPEPELISDLNQLILKQKPEDEDFFVYGHRVWSSYALENDKELESQSTDDTDFLEYLEQFSNEDLTTYFSFLFEALDKFDIKEGDNRLLFSTTNNNLSFTIGQRYSWNLFKTKKKGKFGVLSINKIRENSEEFTGNAPYPFYTYLNEINFSESDRDSIFRGFDQELKRTNRTGFRKHNNQEFEHAVFDKSFRAQFIKTTSMDRDNKVLNKILFGPPGTGKTYNTINESLLIVDPKFYEDNKGDREALNKRFKELLIKDWEKTTGQIAFCTFHQSFSYEDFVEGIKPKVNDNKDVYYETQDGVFKKICQLADSSISAVKMQKEGKLSWSDEQFNKASFYKLSLGDSNKAEDKEIYEYCRDNNYIAIGFGGGLDFTGMSESEIKEFCADAEELGETHAQQLNYFIHYIKVGNYVLISNGNKFVRALGKVIGEYQFDANAPIKYNQFRKVEWIFKDENIPVEELYNRSFSQQTLYKIDEHGLKKEFFVNHGQVAESEPKKVKDYVLIIDEINRGNVSSIFGELITLIEKDKRAGGQEELEVTLPYSKEPFKVPHNVYIVGTMNTADRSIEALDTALRRRFAFDEKPPKPELILTEGNSGQVNGIVEGINLKTLLETINIRIEKLIDKDHKIGHSYFLKVNSKKSLIHCFENEVIPLLEEYFFGDYGKIGLVLGDSFVAKDDSEAFEFAKFEGYDSDVSSDLKERSVYKIRASKDWDFNRI